MASKIKERKVYGLTNFRGLDKESKLLKVSPFRASGGKNFIIDSDTLKTRPAFKYDRTPLKKVNNEEIIDFYKFREVFVFVTKKGFYFKYNNVILSDITTPTLKSPFHIDLDFEGLTPYFQEEQNSLFIFCLNDVFVVSNLYNEENGALENVVIYSIKNKPTNPFTVSDSYYEVYENLPIPYEPTLFIGDNLLDDVNLLSNVSKYRLFAKNSPYSQEGVNTYYLPTHYDQDKHGKKDFLVEFYKNKFKDLDIFPIYLGKLNENFTDLAPYGDVINVENPIELQQDFMAKEPFEYKGDRENNPTPIKEILGLTKEDFFELKIKENTQRVYEYILNYIQLNYSKDETFVNKVLKFKLPYERISYYRNAETNDIEKTYKEQREESIYVQLKKFNVNGIGFKDKSLYQSPQVSEFTLENDFPSYPTTPTVDVEFNITPNPIEKVGYKIGDFESLANTWLEQNKYREEFTNGKKIKLLGRFFENKTSATNEALNVESESDWLKSERTSVIYNDIDSFPNYPSFDNPGLNPVLEANNIYSTSGQNVSLSRFYDSVVSEIRRRINEMPSDKTIGYFKFRWQTYYGDGQGTFYDEGQSVVVKFSYQKTGVINYELRSSFAMTLTFVKEQTNIVDGLYSLEFDDSMGAFVFKCKDYFYDYNNEPSIDIKVTFERNPDFNIIANSKFGITFGSENRLFLAGNKDYPHIDRYNVSNDLLGNNIKNQSYELSYFPSKNYRVLGGKGAINGYVLATDTQLYITKEDYPNDQKLFIRNRTMDDNGIVGYNEFKTNIDKTPLNNKCIVRFYNDILVLDEKGLYGIEISSNVLTNERLVKMRSGFINKELTKQIKSYGKEKVLIYEDNAYMYIFIGNSVFVADSRYISQNPNSEIENYSYEIVEWDIPFEVKSVKKLDGRLYLLESSGKHIYVIEEDNTDDLVERKTNYGTIKKVLSNVRQTTSFSGANIDNYLENKNITFTFDNERIFKYLALNSDFSIIEKEYSVEIQIKNEFSFRGLKDEDIIYMRTTNETYKGFEVKGLDDSSRNAFFFNENINNLDLNSDIFIDVSNKKLYPKLVFQQNGINRIILSPLEQKEIKKLVLEGVENQQYFEEVVSYDDDYCGYIFPDRVGENTLRDVLITTNNPIELEWLSGVLDLGSDLQEKTMFRTHLYVSKQDESNEIYLGYRTMRRYDSMNILKGVDIANVGKTNLENLTFSLFSINTFAETGSSFPTKESNFLYIQFVIKSVGKIQLNGIKVIYKLNRLLKSIG